MVLRIFVECLCQKLALSKCFIHSVEWGKSNVVGRYKRPPPRPPPGYQGIPGYPKISGDSRISEDIKGYQDIRGYQGIPGHPSISGDTRISEYIRGYQDIRVYQGIPGYPRISGYDSTSGYPCCVGTGDPWATLRIFCFCHIPSCWFRLWLLIFNFRFSNNTRGY